MTRINTNVSSLNAQKNLQRSNAQLQQALTRLSTGLKINSGKDDPAGLIAGVMLGSEIVGTNTAIANTELANQIISTADSALSQISSLLEDIRSLVEEAANTGALSQEQIEANQLQIDSSLDAINRIAQTTQFQGKQLLDGSLDYITENVDSAKMSNLLVTSANFGTASAIDVDVQVATQATQGALTFTGKTLSTDLVIDVTGNTGTQTLSLGAGTTAAQIAAAVNQVADSTGVEAELANRVSLTATEGKVTLMNENMTDGITFTSKGTGEIAGDFTVKYVATPNTATTTASWVAGSPNVLQINLATNPWSAAVATGPITVATDGGAGTLSVAADIAGSLYSGVTLTLSDDSSGADQVSSATFDYQNKTIRIACGIGTTATTIQTAINDELGDLFTASGAAGAGTVRAEDFIETAAATEDGFDGDVIADFDSIITALAAPAVADKVTASLVGGTVGGHIVDLIEYSGSIGDMNVGDTDDPNNRIQLTGTALGANTAINFKTNGASQAFSIDFEQNTRTFGKSTALIQATGGGTLQVQAVNQGTAWDGYTISFAQSATVENVAINQQDKTITVTANLSGSTLAQLATIMDNHMGSLFRTTAVSESAGDHITAADSGVTRDGVIYDAINVNLATDANGTATTTAAEVVTAINANTALADLDITASHVNGSTGAGVMETGTVTLSQLGVTAVNQAASGKTYTLNDNASITVTAKTTGAAYDNVKMVVVQDGTAGSEYASYDSADKILTFHISSTAITAQDLVTTINTGSGTTDEVKALFTFSSAGLGNVSTSDTGWIGNLTRGVTYSGTSQGGAESQGNFDANQVVGTKGVILKAAEYGSSQFVALDVVAGSFATTKTVNNVTTTADRSAGTDAVVRINGNKAVTDGLNVSLSSAALSLEFRLASTLAAGSNFNFDIVGGGAKFQLGPQVISGQQASVGIGSISTTHLGGLSGLLYQLKSGNDASLVNNVVKAGAIVDEAIVSTATFRGRLGAFQKTTLDTNIATLEDTVEALTEAKSTIMDADFAAESANLTRAQILAQSGISVLTIANQRPQQVLALLQG